MDQIVKNLEILLADSYSLYLKTQNYHWNVTGPNFHSLHLLFEGQYNDLALAVDLIAERIRALGSRAPGSYSEFVKLSNIKEAAPRVATSTEMLESLVVDHDKMIQELHVLSKLAADNDDSGTASLVDDRISFHEKSRWMLCSSL